MYVGLYQLHNNWNTLTQRWSTIYYIEAFLVSLIFLFSCKLNLYVCMTIIFLPKRFWDVNIFCIYLHHKTKINPSISVSKHFELLPLIEIFCRLIIWLVFVNFRWNCLLFKFILFINYCASVISLSLKYLLVLPISVYFLWIMSSYYQI